jgi:transcriptional regulator with XRE-family HTH domain
MVLLRVARIIFNRSVSEIVKATGINRTLIYQIETNRLVPRPDELKRLADYFNVDPPEKLLTHVDERQFGLGAGSEVRFEQRQKVDRRWR